MFWGDASSSCKKLVEPQGLVGELGVGKTVVMNKATGLYIKAEREHRRVSGMS